ncbi:MAG: tyrosine-type recombinase/integrase, partial [Planctomycetota bacterium]
MAIRKKTDNKWLIDITLGRKRRHRVIFNGTKEEAAILERDIRRKLGKTVSSNETVADLIEPYLRWVKTYQSEKTFKEKKKILFAHILYFFGNMCPDLISSQVIERYKEKRLEAIKERGRYKGFRAVNLEILCLQALVKWAKEHGYCSESLVRTKKLPHRRLLPEPLTLEETMSFVNNMEPFYRALFLCFYHAGMRKDETLKLT